MKTRRNRKLMERLNEIRLMNRNQALDRYNNIWIHGTTSINELKAVIERIKI